MTALIALMSCSAFAKSTQPEEITIELNKVEAEGEACQLYFVAKSTAANNFDEFKIEFILFATDGSISRRLIADIGPLKTGRTSVKVFKAAERCETVDGLLINAVKSCGTVTKPDDCHALIKPSSRVETKLFM
jgi:hypothetical protein